jgi:protein arginine kinase
MMFLPALSLSKSPLVSPKALADEALTIRGVYGEGSDTQGFVYQISNKYSLGFSECEIIDGVELSASELGAEEIKARDLLFKTHYNFLMDNILRSFGTLLNCFSIEYLEFLRHIGFIKLGIYYGILGCRDCSML